MCATVKCPECGYPNIQQGKMPESLMCGFCRSDVFLEARMKAADALLREMGQARRDAALKEHWHE